MSSRTAACGQPPVSMAWIRDGGRAELRVRNSASSLREGSVYDGVAEGNSGEEEKGEDGGDTA